MEVGSRVDQDKAVGRELCHVGNSGVHCWAGAVKGGAPSTAMADDVPLPTWGDGPVDGVQDAKQVVEGVETQVEALLVVGRTTRCCTLVAVTTAASVPTPQLRLSSSWCRSLESWLHRVKGGNGGM